MQNAAAETTITYDIIIDGIQKKDFLENRYLVGN